MSEKQLYEEQDKVLRLVFSAREKLFGDTELILGGGTALARFYLKHRVSYDLDFFLATSFSPEILQKRLATTVGLELKDVAMVPRGMFASQLHGYVPMTNGDSLKISFVEDVYSGAFPLNEVGDAIMTETIEGLYHRKVRTLTGSGMGTDEAGQLTNKGARQTARDLFDLYVLGQTTEPLAQFVRKINESGANVPEEALDRGIRMVPWKDLMVDFDRNVERLGAYKGIKLYDMKRYFDEQLIF